MASSFPHRRYLASSGTASAWWSERVIVGPVRLEQYPASLEKLPLFERVERDQS